MPPEVISIDLQTEFHAALATARCACFWSHDPSAGMVQFVPWQPSAWPVAPADNHEFVLLLKRIFELSMLLEISNVMEDAIVATGALERRGHVIAIALFCALDAISSYGYGRHNGKQMQPFISAHFPDEYKPHAHTLLTAYRHSMVHSWNLFTVVMRPGNEPITENGGILSLCLRNFFEALKTATEDFLESLPRNPTLIDQARNRYDELRRTARRLR